MAPITTPATLELDSRTPNVSAVKYRSGWQRQVIARSRSPRLEATFPFRFDFTSPKARTRPMAALASAKRKKSTSKGARFPRADFVKRKEKPKMTAYPIPAR